MRVGLYRQMPRRVPLCAFWVGLVVLLGPALPAGAPAQEELDQAEPVATLSRQMQEALRAYHAGRDVEAMDRFMDVLARGSPAERAMANDYLNLLTKRMSSGELHPAPVPPKNVEMMEANYFRQPAPPLKPTAKAGQPLSAPLKPLTPDKILVTPEVAESQKEVRKREIQVKIKNEEARFLRDLKAAGARVEMNEAGHPEGLGLPTSSLFSTGVLFKKEASRILEALTGLVYHLGATQAVLLPEGASLGEAKILDMRRAMAVSSHLYSHGIAPDRVRMSFVPGALKVPRPLQELTGIAVLFIYNQPFSLVAETQLPGQEGPPASLGVFRDRLRPDKNEGVIIEFSVSEPPQGLMSWRFQLLKPGGAGGQAPLQEVMGGSPVFHQIYWNGRKDYFAEVLPAGRYECRLTATDAKNRAKVLRKWITLETQASLGAAAASAAKAAAAAASSKKVSPKTVAVAKRLPPKPGSGPGGLRPSPPAKKPPAFIKPPGDPAALAPPAEPGPEKGPVADRASQGLPTVIPFAENSTDLTQEGQRKLSSVLLAAYQDYPLHNLEIEGLAHGGESDASRLAEERAKYVFSFLTEGREGQNKIRKDRVTVDHRVVAEAAKSQVLVYFRQPQTR